MDKDKTIDDFYVNSGRKAKSITNINLSDTDSLLLNKCRFGKDSKILSKNLNKLKR